MNEIPGITRIVDNLFIGSKQAAYYVSELRRARITQVLKLYAHDPYWPRDFNVCEHVIRDDEILSLKQLQHGVDFIYDHVRAKRPVLVVCWDSVSRAPTFILGYLLEVGFDLRDAWRLVYYQHRDAAPTMAMWQTLLRHYKLPYSQRDIAEWMLSDADETEQSRV